MTRRKLYTALGIVAGSLLISVGVFASNDWFPKTDSLTGQKYGWFGKKLHKNSTASAWNPIAPDPTPQLSKEYIYAGSRLLAVEDANATVAPPADIAVWRPSNGGWYVMGQPGSSAYSFAFGSGVTPHFDVPLVGDPDGDGKSDLTVYRAGSQSVFYVWFSSIDNYTGVAWGTTGDRPMLADFDGDGKSDYAIARDNGAGALVWWVTTSSNSSHFANQWGNPAHKLAPADYDGDGKADVAVFDPGTKGFFPINSSDLSVSEFYFPVDGTIVSSDYDGDGKADAAIYVPSTATWYIRQSTTNSIVSYVWGNNGASGCTGSCSALVPVHNDYDGDGKTDLAVWDNATNAVWTIKRSSNGTIRTETFGTTGDIPVPAYFRR